MKGNQNGVAAQLKQAVPWIIANHCVAHRLTLASAQAADEIPYIKRFKSILGLVCTDIKNILLHIQLDS